MDADLSVDKIEINPSNVAATMAATQDRIEIAPAKKPKPQTKPRPQKAADWTVSRVTAVVTEAQTTATDSLHSEMGVKLWTLELER